MDHPIPVSCILYPNNDDSKLDLADLGSIHPPH